MQTDITRMFLKIALNRAYLIRLFNLDMMLRVKKKGLIKAPLFTYMKLFIKVQSLY